MKTTQIITSQIKYIIENAGDFTKICLPYALILIVDLYIIESSLYYYPFIIIGSLVGALMVINIHRHIILNDKNYYSLSQRLKLILIYFCYSGLLTVLCIGSFLFLLVAYQITDNIIIQLIFFSTAILVFLFAYPSLVLNLPMVAAGEKIKFFRMWKLSKEFKLTLFLQILFIGILLMIMLGLLSFILANSPVLFTLISKFLGLVIYVLIVACLSKTYLLWKENHNI